jgi:hypothetical protein
MKCLNVFLFLWVIFALLDPNPQHRLGPRKGQQQKHALSFFKSAFSSAHFSPFLSFFEERHGILNQPPLLRKSPIKIKTNIRK